MLDLLRPRSYWSRHVVNTPKKRDEQKTCGEKKQKPTTIRKTTQISVIMMDLQGLQTVTFLVTAPVL